jgi:uncharacterized protein (TIGR03435 family)
MMTAVTRRCLSVAALLTLTPGLSSSFAQTASSATEAAPPIAFDVASIRPSDPNAQGSSTSWNNSSFRSTNTDAMGFISSAWGIRRDLITGAPGWVNSDRYDVTAKIDAADVARFEKLKGSERTALLKPLLVERFKLEAHTEVKQLPTYDLVIAKGGPKLVDEKEHTEPDPDHPAPQGTVYSGWMWGNGTSLHGKGIPLKSLISSLEGMLERTIIDKTGLTGNKYEFMLKWTPEDKPQTDDNAPPLLTALQDQLGLRLVPSKGPVETLVIDHIEKPSPN